MKVRLWGRETNPWGGSGHAGDIIRDRTCRRENPGLEYFIHSNQEQSLEFCVPYPHPPPILLLEKSSSFFFLTFHF